MSDVKGTEATVPTSDKGLRAGVLGFVSSVFAAIASLGPALALAVVVGAVVTVAGNQAPAVLLLGFIPVVMTLLAFRELNAVQPDCGTTFVWVGRATNPALGFLSGWGLLGAGMVSMPASLYVATLYFLDFVGLPDLAEDKIITLVIGLIVMVILTSACYLGIQAAARVQQVLVAIEVFLVGLLLVVGIWKVSTGDVLEGAATFEFSWFNPGLLEGSAVAAGVMLVMFAFWGWDITFTLSEETETGSSTAGRAAAITLVGLLGVYIVGIVVFLTYAGPDFVSSNAETLIDAIGQSVLGMWAAKLLVLCVFTSVLAATQATMIQAARVLLAMGSYGALPSVFAKINRFKSPGFSTLLVGGISAVMMILLVMVSTDILFDALSATGLLVAVYYGLTCVACTWLFRRTLLSSVRNFVVRGLCPMLAAIVMAYAFYQTAVKYLDPANSTSEIFGMGTIFVLSVGALVLGLVVLVLVFFTRREYFSGRTLRAGLNDGDSAPISRVDAG